MEKMHMSERKPDFEGRSLSPVRSFFRDLRLSLRGLDVDYTAIPLKKTDKLYCYQR